MLKDAAKKAPWEIAVEKLAATTAAFAAEAKARAEEFAAEARARDAKFAAEADRRAAESDERMTRFEEGMAKLRKDLEKTGEMLKEITRANGERANDRGFALERAVWNVLTETREICGISLDGGVRFNVHDDYGFQYDMVGLNGKKTVVIETKLSLSEKDVLHFADNRLPYFARMLPEYGEGKEVIGAMIYQRTDPAGAAVSAALSRGLLVLSADNKKRLRQIRGIGDIKERNTPPRRRKPG